MSWRAESTYKAPSALSDAEKDFLKLAKKLRDILKLEEKRSKGETLDKTQEQKMGTKDALIKDLVVIAAKLPMNTEQMSKNPDILALLPADKRARFEQLREKEVHAQEKQAAIDDRRREQRDQRDREERSKPIWMPRHDRPIVGVCCGGDDYIYTCSKDKFVIGWSMAKRLLSATVTYAGHDGAVWALDLSPSDSAVPGKLASGAADGKVMLWSGRHATRKKPQDQFIASPDATLDHGGVVRVLRWCPFDKGSSLRLASASEKFRDTPAAISVFSCGGRGPPELVHRITNIPAKANDIQWAGGSMTKLISAHENGWVGIWKGEDGGLLKKLQLHKNPVMSLALTPNYNTLVTCSTDRTAIVVDISSKDCSTVDTIEADRPLRACCVSDNYVPGTTGYVIVGGGRDPKEVTTSRLQENEFDADIVDAASKDFCFARGHFGPVHVLKYMSFLFGGAGGFVTTSEDGQIKIWDLEGQLRHSDNPSDCA